MQDAIICNYLGSQQGIRHCSNSSGKSSDASNKAGRTFLTLHPRLASASVGNGTKELTAKGVLFRSYLLILNKFIESREPKKINIAQ